MYRLFYLVRFGTLETQNGRAKLMKVLDGCLMRLHFHVIGLAGLAFATFSPDSRNVVTVTDFNVLNDICSQDQQIYSCV